MDPMSSMCGMPASPRWLAALGRLIRRIGFGRAVVLVTAVSTLLSIALSVLGTMWFMPDAIAFSIAISGAVSLTVSGSVGYVLCSVVADLERTRGLLWRLVNTDMLTRACSRRHFLETARRVVAGGGNATVVLMDIDDFKQINDRHGHAAGDAVLIGVSRVCRRELGNGVLFARYGGEEFAVLFRGLSTMTVCARMERLRSRIAGAATRLPGGRRLVVTASFGIAALRSATATDPDRALRKSLAAADRALYRAKALGKNRVLIDPLSLPLAPTPRGVAMPAIEALIAGSRDHRGRDHRGSDQRPLVPLAQTGAPSAR